MFCRNCGEEVNENAVACPNCGVPPWNEKHYCHECGGKTKENQVVCLNCGISLENIEGKIRKSSKDKDQTITSDDYDGFYRSSDDKVLMGVCGGLAHKLNASSLLIRVLVVLLAPFGFISVIGYIIIAAIAKGPVPTK